MEKTRKDEEKTKKRRGIVDMREFGELDANRRRTDTVSRYEVLLPTTTVVYPGS